MMNTATNIKRVITLAVISGLLFGCGQDETEENIATKNTGAENTAEQVSEESDEANIEYIGGYEKAVHEKFDSPASENGLGGTLVYIEGTFDDIKKFGKYCRKS